MKAGKKIQKKLDNRLQDFRATIDRPTPGASKVEQRKSTGGFHCPGSRQR